MTEQSQRTTVEVILELESKMDQIINLMKTQDMNVKVISNKMNQMIQSFAQLSLPPQQNVMAFAPLVAPTNSIYPPEESDVKFTDYTQNISMEMAPVGFRRTSRPETFDTGNGNNKNVPTPSLPTINNLPAPDLGNNSNIKAPTIRKAIKQRIVDKNSKALFMAEVEILNTESNIVEIKTRTNAMGIWQASLSSGQYKVKIRKLQTMDKDKIEVIQNLTVDDRTPQELQMMIVK